MTYNFPLWDIVEEHEIAKYGDETDETKTGNNIYDSVLKGKLSWKIVQDIKNFSKIKEDYLRFPEQW